MAPDGGPVEANVVACAACAQKPESRGAVGGVGAGKKFGEIGHAVAIGIGVGIIPSMTEVLVFPGISQAIAIQIGDGFNAKIVDYDKIVLAADGTKRVVVANKDVATGVAEGGIVKLSNESIVHEPRHSVRGLPDFDTDPSFTCAAGRRSKSPDGQGGEETNKARVSVVKIRP